MTCGSCQRRCESTIQSPRSADQIFSQMNLEEVLKLTEVCEDWSQAVLHSKKVQDRVSQVSLYKAAVQGWMGVAKFLLDRGDDQNSRLVCDGDCYTKNVPHEHCYRCDFCEETALGMALSWTPLHGAVALGRKEMTELLLSHGADASLKLRLFNLMPGYLTRTTRCTHEVSALQISRMEHPSRRANGYNRSQWEESGYQTPQKQREVEEILMQNCANEAERNIGVPVCETCFGYGVRRVSLPELLWVFRDFPKRMDHSANDGEDGIPTDAYGWNVYRCPVRRFNLE